MTVFVRRTGPGGQDRGHEDDFDLDGRAVRAAFDRASAHYEAAALLQKRVREELLQRLELVSTPPAAVLDLGSGTGQAALELARRFPRARVIALDLAYGMLREARRHAGLFRKFDRLCADARALPLRTASVDLVFSSLMLQWCPDPTPAFAEIRRVLKPNGLVAFSTFGPDTLHELRAAWAAANGHAHVNRFLDVHDVGDSMTRAGLGEPVLDVERIETSHPDALQLMRELKTIGARNALAARPRGLTGRGELRRMVAAYETLRRDGSLPATYEVIYGVGWGAPERVPPAAGAGAEAVVPVSSIGRGRRSR